MDFRLKLKLPGLAPFGLSRPDHGLKVLAEHALHAGIWAGPLAAKLRPALFSVYQVRRKLATAAVAVLTAWLFAHVMFGANGMVVYRQKKTEYQTLQSEIDDLQKRHDSHSSQVKALKTDPKAIEQEAREQLHYARPGEVIYVTPPPVPAPRPNLDSARE
jgi:cell division protein FtsB